MRTLSSIWSQFFFFTSAISLAATPPVYETDCALQTAPKTEKEAPHIFNKIHVKMTPGQSTTIFQKGELAYTVQFISREQEHMVIITLIDTRHVRRVTQSIQASHDLNALLGSNLALSPPAPLYAAFCGPQQ